MPEIPPPVPQEPPGPRAAHNPVPDELWDLWEATRADAQGVTSSDIHGERAALAAFAERHEQMVLERVACQPPGVAVLTEEDLATHDAEIERRVRAKVAEEVEPILKDLRKAARTHHYLIACEGTDAALARLRTTIRGDSDDR